MTRTALLVISLLLVAGCGAGNPWRPLPNCKDHPHAVPCIKKYHGCKYRSTSGGIEYQCPGGVG